MRIRNNTKFLQLSKRVLKQSLPPLLLNLLKRMNSSKVIRYSTFQDALAACQNVGYLNSDITMKVAERTNQLRSNSFKNHKLSESDLKILFMAFSASQSGSLRILDFGGGGGYHYFLFKNFCNPATKIDWTVVETPTMIEQCREMVNSELSFISEIPLLAENAFDLIVAGGSLQYTSNPIAVLQQLIQLKPNFLCITRLPMILTDEHFVTIQTSFLSAHGPGSDNPVAHDKTVLTPITFVPKEKVLSLLEHRYAFLQITRDAQSSFYFNGREIPTFGIMCEKF